MEEYINEETDQQDEANSSEAKRWFQDNLRIIVSIVIVIAIAGGIYSYSKRAESPSVTDESIATEKSENITAPVEVSGGTDETKPADVKTAPEKQTPSTVQAPASKETEGSFVETAVKGDGSTVLARRALANYLEKNPDSALTKEHKIYIEDFLRKQSVQKSVRVGSSMEFSKTAIQKAIESSKKLNDKQLKNLQKYSARVTSLS